MTPDSAVGGASFRGMVPTLYDGSGGAFAAFESSRELLKLTRPEAVQVHSWSLREACAAVRTTLPGTKLVAGFGVDGIARDVTKARKNISQGVAQFVALATAAVAAGCVAVVWNAEGHWKRPPTSAERALLVRLIREALAAVAARFPTLLQWHTAYDHPGYHSTYPWEAWLGAGSPVLASLPQVYAAPDGGVMAHRGALPARESRALSSWASAVKAGWIRADAPAGSPGDLTDCDWLPYYQLHHVTTRDTVAAVIARPLSFGWALPTRSDAAGRDAFVVCAAARLLGCSSVRELQAKLGGLAVDDVAGPATAAASRAALASLEASGKGLALP